MQFSGIHEAKGIADNKVQISFFAADADPRDITYSISYDGLPIPITVPGETLQRDYRGLLNVIVDGLDINTEYSFSVQAFTDAASSVSSKVEPAKTFANRTGDFYGVARVRNLSGSDGKNSIFVDWSAATREGSEVGLKKEVENNLQKTRIIIYVQ